MDRKDMTGQPARLSAGHYIPFAFPGVPGVACVFTTALAGTMSLVRAPDMDRAVENRERLRDGLGIDRWAEVRQVHGNAMLCDPEPTAVDAQPEREADGLCTRTKGLALVIKTADCQPILLTDRKGSAIAALHSGWRGNAMNFPATGLARFCEAYQLNPGEVLAVRGPSLGPGAAEFVNFDREWPPEFAPWFDAGRRAMDLWSLLRHQLIQAGMAPENIFGLDLCTRSLPELFFSHRLGHTGRQASLIWIRKEPALEE